MEGGKISSVEGEKKLTEPCMFCVLERVEDRVEEELAEVVDRFAQQCGNGKVISTFLLLLKTELLNVNAGKVEESILIVGCKLEFGLDIYQLLRCDRFLGEHIHYNSRHSHGKMKHERLIPPSRMFLSASLHHPKLF